MRHIISPFQLLIISPFEYFATISPQYNDEIALVMPRAQICLT
jgi:hypothetical protein